MYYEKNKTYKNLNCFNIKDKHDLEKSASSATLLDNLVDRLNKRPANEYTPTTIEVYKSKFSVNFQEYVLSITDLSGNNDDIHAEMRKYYYLVEKVASFFKYSLLATFQSKLVTFLLKDIDVVLICFSLINLTSFMNVMNIVGLKT